MVFCSHLIWFCNIHKIIYFNINFFFYRWNMVSEKYWNKENLNTYFLSLYNTCYWHCIWYTTFSLHLLIYAMYLLLCLSYIYIKIIFLLQRFFWFYHPNHHFIGILTCFLVTFLLFFSYIVDLFLKGKTLGQLKYKSNRTAVSKPRCSQVFSEAYWWRNTLWYFIHIHPSYL